SSPRRHPVQTTTSSPLAMRTRGLPWCHRISPRPVGTRPRTPANGGEPSGPTGHIAVRSCAQGCLRGGREPFSQPRRLSVFAALPLLVSVVALQLQHSRAAPRPATTSSGAGDEMPVSLLYALAEGTVGLGVARVRLGAGSAGGRGDSAGAGGALFAEGFPACF